MHIIYNGRNFATSEQRYKGQEKQIFERWKRSLWESQEWKPRKMDKRL